MNSAPLWSREEPHVCSIPANEAAWCPDCDRLFSITNLLCPTCAGQKAIALISDAHRSRLRNSKAEPFSVIEGGLITIARGQHTEDHKRRIAEKLLAVVRRAQLVPADPQPQTKEEAAR